MLFHTTPWQDEPVLRRNDVEDDDDGFEGNAQSFRVVTRLAAHRPLYKGLNLTRATLNASLKYPWLRDAAVPKKAAKFSAYVSDRAYFDWVRSGSSQDNRPPEAQIMDLADDIAYSVHDLEDFIRAGLIPFERLRDPIQLKEFIDEWLQWAETKHDKALPDIIDKHRGIAPEWLANIFPSIRGDADFEERAALKEQTAGTIRRFVMDASLTEPDSDGVTVHSSPESRFLMKFCQRLVWHFVISSPRLASIQHGQRAVIRNLMLTYRKAVTVAVNGGASDLVPPRFRIELGSLDPKDKKGINRLAVDIVASMTDEQAVTMHRRFCGIEQRGSITDIVHN